MTQVVETEHLERCPFCGGKAELRVADHAFREDMKIAKVVCLQCNAGANSFIAGKEFFSGITITIDEAIKKAANAWNRRRCKERGE